MLSRTMEEFRWPVRVYIEDTDAGGIVYYVNYLKYMERARTELLRHFGYDKPAFWTGNRMFVVHSVNLNYRKPARLDDCLEVSARIDKVGRTYFEVAQNVRRDNEILCEGVVKVANVTCDTMKPAVLPAQMREQFIEQTKLTVDS